MKVGMPSGCIERTYRLRRALCGLVQGLFNPVAAETPVALLALSKLARFGFEQHKADDYSASDYRLFAVRSFFDEDYIQSHSLKPSKEEKKRTAHRTHYRPLALNRRCTNLLIYRENE